MYSSRNFMQSQIGGENNLNNRNHPNSMPAATISASSNANQFEAEFDGQAQAMDLPKVSNKNFTASTNNKAPKR